jgi:sugar phosphate isomerase/epimerase
MENRVGKIGVVAASLSDDARVAARAAREFGFGGLLFDATTGALDLTTLSQTGRREFAQVMSSQAQTLIGLRGELGAKGFGPGADVDRQLARLDAVCRAAADMRAEVVCLDLGPLPAPAKTETPKPRVTPEQAGLIILPDPIGSPAPEPAAHNPPPDPAFVSQVDAALAALGEIAERYAITVALSSALSSFAALERAIVAVRCPWFGVDLDAVAMLGDTLTTDEVFSRLAPVVRHVRARDAVKGDGARTKPTILGRGSTNWRELLGSLDASDYRGWVTIDAMELSDRAGAARAGFAQLRAFLTS